VTKQKRGKRERRHKRARLGLFFLDHVQLAYMTGTSGRQQEEKVERNIGKSSKLNFEERRIKSKDKGMGREETSPQLYLYSRGLRHEQKYLHYSRKEKKGRSMPEE